MFDEDLFGVFNEGSSSADAPVNKTESASSRDVDTKARRNKEKGNLEGADRKRSVPNGELRVCRYSGAREAQC